MIRSYFRFRSSFCATILLVAAALAQQTAYSQVDLVPRAILSAKKIFVSNAGADSGLFPSPFSGDPSRAYSEFYFDLKAAGQFELTSDPGDADLVLEIQLTAPSGPAWRSEVNKVNGASDPLPMLRLVIYDRKTHFILWTETQSIEVAYTQKSHDRNLDLAIRVLMERFQQLTGKPLTTDH
ncbi:MAG: hypothetical protein ABR907_05260 [Terracidiphilus sp.]|jgi:hypothetical protein